MVSLLSLLTGSPSPKSMRSSNQNSKQDVGTPTQAHRKSNSRLQRLSGEKCPFCLFFASSQKLVDAHLSECHPKEIKNLSVIKALRRTTRSSHTNNNSEDSSSELMKPSPTRITRQSSLMNISNMSDETSEPNDCKPPTPRTIRKRKRSSLQSSISDADSMSSKSDQLTDHDSAHLNIKGKTKLALKLELLRDKKLSKSSFWRSQRDCPSKRFQCDKCVQSFNNKDHYRAHVLDTNSPARQFVCQICKHRFETRVDLSKHLGEDHVPEHLRCSLCGKVRECCISTNHINTNSNHIDYIYSIKEKNFDCGFCLKTFYRFSALRNHKKSHKKTQKMIFVRKNKLSLKKLKQRKRIERKRLASSPAI